MPGTHLGLTTADGRRPRVAVVDGNAASAMVTTMLVEQFGCAPLPALTGEAALALLRMDEAVDLVVMDLAIPDMDAVVAAQLIHALASRGALPIVALAGAKTDIASRRGAVGFCGAVVKPYSPRELYGAMLAALAQVPVPAA